MHEREGERESTWLHCCESEKVRIFVLGKLTNLSFALLHLKLFAK